MSSHDSCIDPNCTSCSPRKFAHLHQHTQYSLLDGAAKLKDLLKWVKEVTPNDPACAITDHGNMHGAVHFFNYAQQMGVKPIIGYEAYVVPGMGTRRDKKPGQSGEKGIFHLTLLARDFEGYQNLCRLTSRGYTEGYYYKPRIDHELLMEHHKGIIAFSGCLGAEVPQLIMQDRLEQAKERLLWYQSLFKENYYIEVQDHGIPEQVRVNQVLRQWAKELGIGMVATNDGHYVKREDAKPHDALLAIQTKATLADENRFKFPCEEFYVKSLDEMQQALPVDVWGDEPFDNTADIARMCNVELPVGKKRVYQMPALPIPEGRTMSEELRVQTYRGMMKRYPEHLTEPLIREYICQSWEKARNPEALEAYYKEIYQPKLDGDKFTEEKFEALDFKGRGAKLQKRLPGFDPKTADFETLYAAMAFMGSMWEDLGKAVSEKYTKYPALEDMEALCKDGGCMEGFTKAQYDHALVLLRRAEYELSVINNMGFPDYFLIVADYINWAKDHDISVGPGRGSGAGSLVAYAIRITNLDPLEFELLFERFLNPDRISMPDFDIDFNDQRREEVIAYVREKYGDDKVAQIATFGTMASKACLKDVSRVMGVQYADVDKVSKLIPVKFGKSYSLEQARESVPDIQDMLKANKELAAAYEFAQKLEGLTRHASVHAAGVVIGRDNLTDLVPLMRDNSGEGIVCQYDMKACEDIGLIKMDFLGLRTLSFLDEAKKILKDSKNILINFDEIPFDDEATFELMGRGECKGIFQFEGGGIADATRRMKPKRLADLVAMSALYRPGPMENIPTYIRRHHGQEPVTYPDFPTSEKWLEPILRETYGIPVYQEQIMQIASTVAGYSLGGADLLRRAMGKKDANEMKNQRILFVNGSKNNNVPEEESNKLFDLLEKFANYGFNKCLIGDTEIVGSDGQKHTIKAMFEQQIHPMLPSVADHYTFTAKPVTGVFENGVKPVFEVKTSLGKTLTATGNHPLLTLDGWKNLEDLQEGDRIASPARLPIEGPNQWPEHQLAMLGWVLSEGNTCHPCGVYVYTQSEIMLQDVLEAAEHFENTSATTKNREDRQNVYDIYLGTGQRGQSGRSGVRLWLESLGMVGQTALEKHFPREVFSLNNDNLAVLLGRYWSGDGFVYGEGNTTPYAATSSKKLAFELQHLLLRLGMVSKVSEKTFKYKEGRTGYTVHLVGRRSILRFIETIGQHLVGRDHHLTALQKYLASVPEHKESVDTLPAQVKTLVQQVQANSGLTWKQVEQQSGVCVKELYGAVKPHKKGFRRHTIEKLAEFFESPHLQEVCSEDLFWETIESITPAGEQMTYDLEVSSTHNFVANDIVVHNSHSAAYGVISYQTAWLKANHPVEFMAALLTVERRDSDKVSEYVSDARKMGVVVLPPDINHSGADFKVVRGQIYFGLYAIKGLGENAVEFILAERANHGPYKSLPDFCKRVSSKTANRKALENLIKAGAFDMFGERKSLLESLEEALSFGQASQQDNGMDSLFGAATTMPEPKLKQVEPFTELERLSAEKEALGLYISGHPLEQYEGLREAASCTILHLENYFQQNRPNNGRLKVVLAGMLEAIVKKPTKSGGMMAKFNLADESGVIELVAFSKAYDRVQHKLIPDSPALVIVDLEDSEGSIRAIAEEIVTIDSLTEVPKVAWLHLDLDQTDNDALRELASFMDEYAGNLPVRMKVTGNGMYASLEVSGMKLSSEGIKALSSTFKWVDASVAYDNSTILSKFAPKPRWQGNGGGFQSHQA